MKFTVAFSVSETVHDHLRKKKKENVNLSAYISSLIEADIIKEIERSFNNNENTEQLSD